MPLVNKPKTGTPLVTVEEVDAWREELRDLKTEQENIAEKIRDLEAHLAAADFFIRDRAVHKVMTINIVPAAETKPSMPPTMQDAVLRVLQKNPSGMEPKQISNVIRIDPEIPLKLKNAHPNYIYTVLMRLVQQHKIGKEGAIYKLIPKIIG